MLKRTSDEALESLAPVVTTDLGPWGEVERAHAEHGGRCRDCGKAIIAANVECLECFEERQY